LLFTLAIYLPCLHRGPTDEGATICFPL